MEKTAIENLIDFCAGDVFDSQTYESSPTPENPQAVEPVRRKTDEFNSLLNAARAEIEGHKLSHELLDLIVRVEVKLDRDSVITFRRLIELLAEEVPSPFITSGAFRDDVSRDPCFFIGSSKTVAKFRSGETLPEFK